MLLGFPVLQGMQATDSVHPLTAPDQHGVQSSIAAIRLLGRQLARYTHLARSGTVSPVKDTGFKVKLVASRRVRLVVCSALGGLMQHVTNYFGSPLNQAVKV